MLLVSSWLISIRLPSKVVRASLVAEYLALAEQRKRPWNSLEQLKMLRYKVQIKFIVSFVGNYNDGGNVTGQCTLVLCLEKLCTNYPEMKTITG